jgi:hypothetical protein
MPEIVAHALIVEQALEVRRFADVALNTNM